MGIPDPYNPDPADKELSAKERIFVFYYLQTWNHVLANKEAGYKSGAKKRFEQPHIQAAITERMKTISMRADEAIYRLTEQARINPAEFYLYDKIELKDKNGNPVRDSKGAPVVCLQPVAIDWELVQARGHMVKGIKYDRHGRPILEFHDAQAALTLIGRHEKLFTDQIDINALTSIKAYVGISPDDWDEMSDNGTNDDNSNDPDS